MAKFDAGSAVEVMEYDFTKYDGGQGEIPEPSRGQVELFFERIAELKKFTNKAMRDGETIAEDDESGEELEKFIEELSEGELKKYQAELSVWAADVCSQEPSVEDINKLPYRVFGAFMAYLAGELGPKDENGSSPSPVASGLRSSSHANTSTSPRRNGSNSRGGKRKS